MLELTIYFVGTDEITAAAGLPFDAYESAQSYLADQGPDTGENIYSATATVDLSTMTREG